MAEGQFYIAFVDPEETTFEPEHSREDVEVASFSLSHGEGEFAVFSMVIKNPLQGLLAPSRKRHAWVSWHGPSGVAALLFGRIVGVPADINRMRTVITIRARPDNYEALKAALFETLKVAPYWDPVWIPPDHIDDPDFALQARSARYHVNRTTHAVTISDLIVPEDGTLEFDADDGVTADSVNITYAGPGKSRARVRAEIGFTQRALGTIDVSKNLTDAFAATGTTQPGMVSTYTWEHLADSWPLPGDGIGGGWTWFDSNVELGNNRWIQQEEMIANTLTVWAQSYFGAIGEEFGFGFPQIEEQVGVNITLGVMRPTMIAQFTAERSRVEIVEFELISDIQPVLSEPGDDAPILINLSSNDVSEPVDLEGEEPATPLLDPRRTTYMKTDRGVQSMNYLMARARAELIDHARIVHVTFTVPFRHVLDVSLRKSAILYDPRLPGGQATGKIINYVATGDTSSGAFTLTITIACAIGYGGTVASVVGDPVYVAAGYVGPGYQQYDNAVTLLGTADVAYDDYRSYAVDDDGIDFFNPTPQDLLLSIVVTNGPDQQEGAIAPTFSDVRAAEVALAQVRTQVCVDFKPVVGGPFETIIPVTTHPLVIPQQIDLEAA